MPAPKGNKNAAGQRVQRERIKLSLSLSERNGLADLTSEYLLRQGIDPTNENIASFVSDWFYLNYGNWLKRQIEMDDTPIIV